MIYNFVKCLVIKTANKSVTMTNVSMNEKQNIFIYVCNNNEIGRELLILSFGCNIV